MTPTSLRQQESKIDRAIDRYREYVGMSLWSHQRSEEILCPRYSQVSDKIHNSPPSCASHSKCTTTKSTVLYGVSTFHMVNFVRVLRVSFDWNKYCSVWPEQEFGGLQHDTFVRGWVGNWLCCYPMVSYLWFVVSKSTPNRHWFILFRLFPRMKVWDDTRSSKATGSPDDKGIKLHFAKFLA